LPSADLVAVLIVFVIPVVELEETVEVGTAVVVELFALVHDAMVNKTNVNITIATI